MLTMNIRKKIIFIILAIVFVIVIATVTTIILNLVITHPSQSTSTASSTDALKKAADTAYKNGLIKENAGDAAGALKYYEIAYTDYKKLNDGTQEASLVLKINYMKEILEKAGQKVTSTVDTSADTESADTDTTTDTGNKSTPLPSSTSPVITAPAVGGTPSPDTTGTPATN